MDGSLARFHAQSSPSKHVPSDLSPEAETEVFSCHVQSPAHPSSILSPIFFSAFPVTSPIHTR